MKEMRKGHRILVRIPESKMSLGIQSSGWEVNMKIKY
jgi:hypothetical protein